MSTIKVKDELLNSVAESVIITEKSNNNFTKLLNYLEKPNANVAYVVKHVSQLRDDILKSNKAISNVSFQLLSDTELSQYYSQAKQKYE